MAKDIAIHCQFCGKLNRFYPPSPEQLGAKYPNKFQSKELQSMAGAFDYGTDETPARSPRRSAFWAALWNSEAGTNVSTGLFAGGGSYLLTWLSGVDPAWAVAAGLGAGVGLPVLKVLLYVPSGPKAEKPKGTTIKTELKIQRSDGKWDYVFDELRDKGVSVGDLEKAAKAIYPDPDLPGVKRLSVKTIAKQGMTYSHARKVLAELQEREWVTTSKGNKSIVTMYRGAPFLEKLLK